MKDEFDGIPVDELQRDLAHFLGTEPEAETKAAERERDLRADYAMRSEPGTICAENRNALQASILAALRDMQG